MLDPSNSWHVCVLASQSQCKNTNWITLLELSPLVGQPYSWPEMYARLYAMGEKYGLKGLKTVAATRFDLKIKTGWKRPWTDAFYRVLHLTIAIVYSDTPATDRVLRDRIVAFMQAYWKDFQSVKWEGVDNGLTRDLIEKYPDLANDMLASKPLTVSVKEPVYKGSCRRCDSTTRWKADHVTCECGWGERFWMRTKRAGWVFTA